MIGNVGKYADIERVNKILLTKMSQIMQETKPQLYNPGKHHSIVSYRVDRVAMPSLNQVKRKKELIKISNENQIILKRLQGQAPTYSVNKWEKDFRKNLYLRQNLL